MSFSALVWNINIECGQALEYTMCRKLQLEYLLGTD